MSKTNISWVVAISVILASPAYAGFFSAKTPVQEFCGHHLKFKSYWMGNLNCQPIIDAVTAAAQRGKEACLAAVDPNASISVPPQADAPIGNNAASCLAPHSSPCDQLSKIVDDTAKPLRVGAREMVEEAIESDDALYKQIRDQKFPGVDYFMQEDCKKISANATAQVWQLESELKETREKIGAVTASKQPPTPPQPGVKCNRCGISTAPGSVSASAPGSVSASAPGSVSASAPASVSASDSGAASGPRPCNKCGLNNSSSPASVSASAPASVSATNGGTSRCANGNCAGSSSCANGNCGANSSAPVDAPAGSVIPGRPCNKCGLQSNNPANGNGGASNGSSTGSAPVNAPTQAQPQAPIDAPSGPQVLRPIPDEDPAVTSPVPTVQISSQPLPEPAAAPAKPAPVLIDAPTPTAPDTQSAQPAKPASGDLGHGRDASAPATGHPAPSASAPSDAPADAPAPVVHHRHKKPRKPAHPSTGSGNVSAASAGGDSGIMIPTDMAVKAALPDYNKGKGSLFHTPTPAELGQYQDEQRLARDKAAASEKAKENEARLKMEHSYVDPKTQQEQKDSMSAFQRILKAHQPSPLPLGNDLGQ